MGCCGSQALKSSMLTYFSPPELRLVPPRVIKLVLVLGHPFIDRDNTLAHSVGLPRLDAWD